MAKENRIVSLDARPYLRKKLEPFQLIMDTVGKLAKDEVLILHATFKPTPLLGLMKMKGYSNRVEMVRPEHWVTAFAHKSLGKKLLDDLDFEAYAGMEEGAVEDLSSEGETPVSNAEPKREPEESFQGRTKELDNRGLQPPQPMVRTLKALETSAPGDRVVIHNDRVPMFLIEELQRLGYPYSVEQQQDGSAKVTIHKA